MSKVALYNLAGETVGEALLPKEIFDVKIKTDLIKQVANIQMANKRQVLANTKDRAQVRGGGKKPWRQKGTGRARHGSRRSPIWKGGGITFGPTKERNFSKIISKKMRKLALFMVLSAKAKENVVVVLDNFKLDAPKTKLMAGVLKDLRKNIENLKKGKILMALPEKSEVLVRAIRNIPGIQTIEARNLNVLDLLSYKSLVMPKESIKVIKETFLSKE
jgi:large subunit ribosomal protein L4